MHILWIIKNFLPFIQNYITAMIQELQEKFTRKQGLKNKKVDNIWPQFEKYK